MNRSTTTTAPEGGPGETGGPARGWFLAAILVSVGAALFALYPAWLAPAHGVVGDWRHPDMISNHWLYRWVAEQLFQGGSLLHNEAYYWPVGDAPWLAGNGSDAVPAALLAAFLPWPASVTAWSLLMLVLNGLSGWALARAAGSRGPGALLATVALATSPYVVYEMSCARLAQAPVYWFAFFLAAWLRVLDRPTPGRQVVAALLFGATAFTYWYYGLWAVVVGGALFLGRPRVRALLVFVPLALAVTLPPLLVFLGHWSAIPGTSDPPFPHPLAAQSGLPPLFPFWIGGGERRGLVLPLLVLLLPVLGARAVPRGHRWAWLAVAVGFYALALGSWSWADQLAGLAPYNIVYGWTATLRRFWWPYRHELVVLLALLPLAARGLDRLAGQGRRAAAVAAVAVVLVPLDLAARGARLGVQTSWWEPPEPYGQLAGLPGEVILELPLAAPLARSQQTLSYQWVHGKTLLNGHAMWVDRVRPPAWDGFVAGDGFLSALRAYELGQAEAPLALDGAALEALREAGLRYVVVNTEYLPGDLVALGLRYDRLFRTLFGEPALVWRNLVTVWDLAAWTGATTADVPPFAPSERDVSADGTVMAEARMVASLGWRPLPRTFPPEIPPAAGAETALPDLPPMLRNTLRRTGIPRRTGAAPGGGQ